MDIKSVRNQPNYPEKSMATSSTRHRSADKGDLYIALNSTRDTWW